MSEWISAVEEALAGKPSESVEVLRASRPPLLDWDGVQATTSPLLAAFMWAAAVFRESVVAHPMDPLSLLLRFLALALTVRAALLAWQMRKRVGAWLGAKRYALALADEGLVLRTPTCDVAIAREDIVDVRERGDWRQRSGRRWSEVFVVTRPQSGRLYLTIPPLFDRTPGMLAERLMRWLGVVPHPEEPTYPKPEQLASKLYDQVAKGESPAGVTAIRHGRMWLKRGPYATVLLGVAVLDGILRAVLIGQKAVGTTAPFVLGITLVAVPLLWMWFTWKHIKPRKGIALLMTPTEMLMRTREGVLRIRWSNLQKLRIDSKNIWSILEGLHESRTLVIHSKKSPDISYIEAFLGAPAEVVVALGEAYRKGVLP